MTVSDEPARTVPTQHAHPLTRQHEAPDRPDEGGTARAFQQDTGPTKIDRA